MNALWTLPALFAAALAVDFADIEAAMAAQAERESAEAFLHRVYAPYVKGEQSASPTGKGAPALFDSHLTALIRKDQASAKGEVGALDQDPICDCQDFDRLKILSIEARPGGKGRASATVRFLNGAENVSLEYVLVSTEAGWRIADIGSKEMPSLSAFLEKADARH